MADDRYGAQAQASNSPHGEEDRDRHEGGHEERGLFERARSWLGFGEDDPEGQYGRGTQSWGQANEGGNWGSGTTAPERGHYGPEHGRGGFQGDYGGGRGQGGFGGRGDWEGGRQSFTSGSRSYRPLELSHGPMDDAYLSWRERQIAELDRDYEEYCRECGQDFHSSFESWRRNRRAGASRPATEEMTTSASSSTTGTDVTASGGT